MLHINAVTNTEYPLNAIISSQKYYTQDDLKIIATNFHDVEANSINSTACKILHSYNPDCKAVHYQNSGHSQDIQPMEYNKISILRYPFAELTESLTSDTSDKTVSVQLLSDYKSIPIKPSTVSTDYSINMTHFVSWVRIDDEYMKVTDIDTKNNKLTVNRAFIGNGKSNANISSHSKSAMVFGPVYNQIAPSYSNNQYNSQIRYEINIQSQYAVDFLVNATYSAMITHGVDGSWYDLFSLGAFGATDGINDKISTEKIWNENDSQYITCSAYLTSQKNRLTQIYKVLQDKYKISPTNITILANNLSPNSYRCGGGELLVADSPSFPYPLDGYCIEGYAFVESGGCYPDSYLEYHSVSQWIQFVNEFINASTLNITTNPMIASAGCQSTTIEVFDDKMYRQVMLFGYVSYLMGVGCKTTNAKFGIPAMRVANNNSALNGYAYVDDIFYYKIGNPVETKSTIEEYKINDHISYQRAFENGVVLVNPNNETDSNIILSKSYIDPETNKTVNQIDMEAHSGIILLNQ